MIGSMGKQSRSTKSIWDQDGGYRKKYCKRKHSRIQKKQGKFE